jgi:mannan endo-1,4-beta-mannosidase
MLARLVAPALARSAKLARGWRLGICLALAAWTGCGHSAARVTPPAAPVAAGAGQRTPFVSFNIPTLHYIEDDSRFESLRQQRLPDDFEIRDALQTIRLMGGQVVRIYTLSVRKPTDPPGTVRHVLGPNQFNEEAFVALDRVLAAAAELGIQVIMPFVDNWPHWGGIAEYAAFRGKRREVFFTDEQIIKDFEATLDKVLLRTNTINGRAYRDDPTIYAWETGNELARPDAWAARIARYIKQRDPKHALIDGTNGPSIREASLGDPDIDIVSSHHYGLVRRNLELIDENVRKIAGRKRYLIGECGLWTAADTERMFQHVLAQPIEGVLIWGLRGHSREGGFYHHMERPPFQSYHLTGSDSGAAYDEQAIMKMMRTLAFGARRLPVPPIPAPEPPVMLGATSRGAVSFRGSLGARDYAIERQTAPDGPWESVADHFDETLVAYRAFVDPAPLVGKKVRYRVTAANEAGRSPPSSPSGETLIEGRLFVDEMDRAGAAPRSDGDATVTTEHAQRCKMDRARLKGAAGTRVVYRHEGRATAARIYAFTEKTGQVLDVAWSADGHDFTKLATSEESFVVPGGDPNALRPVRITAAVIPSSARELAITWLVPAEIGRVEIDWVPAGP